jgi:hypothetical protein
MKRLPKDKSCDIQILTGAPTQVQKRLDTIFDCYYVVIHSSNMNDKGDIVVIVERRHRQKLDKYPNL